MEQVLAWVASGRLALHISHRFPLEQLDQAFGALLGRKVLGKVLIHVQPGAPAGPAAKL